MDEQAERSLSDPDSAMSDGLARDAAERFLRQQDAIRWPDGRTTAEVYESVREPDSETWRP